MDSLNQLLRSGQPGKTLQPDPTAPEGVSWQPIPAPTVNWSDLATKPATYTPSPHTHPQAEVTNLVSDLASKAPTVHNHDAAYSAINHTHATLPTTSYAALSNGTVAMAFGTNGTVKVTPTANATYTTTVPPAGTRCTLIILTAGASSFTITFGTGFKPVSTLATGTTSARVFVINWVSDGTNLYESSRTAAMVA